MKILIADDEAFTRRLLEGLLTTWGYEVVVTCDGQEAWNALQQPNPPRMAILDWVMPGKDGGDLCQEIRESPGGESVYIMFLTFRYRKEDIDSLLDSGANDYLTKPFDATELRARLNLGLRVLDLQDQLAERTGELEEARSCLQEIQAARS